MALVRSDLRTRYRGSVIGMGWSLLRPIAMTAVLCVVFSQLLGQSIREYAPMLLCGLTFWNFITAVINQGCQCFFQGESYIRQHPAPLAIYPLRTVLGAGFHFLLGFAVAAVFVWCVKGFDNLPAMLSLIPIFVLLFVIGWSLAICMGVANVMFQDTEHLIEVFLQIVFYLTPIMYPAKMLSDKLEKFHAAWLLNLNPFTVLVELLREPLIAGKFPSPEMACLGAFVGLAAVSIASLTLMRFEKRLIFYL